MVNESTRSVSLIEINPRVGGGSVATLVTKLTGTDLFSAAINLALGRPVESDADQAIADKITYCILQPKLENGHLEHIAASHSFTDLVLDKQQVVGEWVQLEKTGAETSCMHKEQYLGELHVHGYAPSLTTKEINRTLGLLINYAHQKKLVREVKGKAR